MTKVITVIIIALVLWGGWELFFYWEKVKNEKETEKKQAIAATVVGETLPGLPPQLEKSYAMVQGDPAAFKKWFKTYGSSIEDPRKAWLELDYALLITRDNPAEARRVFASVKDRTPTSSPIWPRIKQLQKTFE
jgi:hypothetical protein